MNKFFKGLTDNAKIVLSYLSFFAAIGFGIAGMLCPPIGFVHSSILILIAQLLVLCGTFIGLDVKFDLDHRYFHARQSNTQQPGDDKKRKGQEDEINTETEQE